MLVFWCRSMVLIGFGGWFGLRCNLLIMMCVVIGLIGIFRLLNSVLLMLFGRVVNMIRKVNLCGIGCLSWKRCCFFIVMFCF